MTRLDKKLYFAGSHAAVVLRVALMTAAAACICDVVATYTGTQAGAIAGFASLALALYHTETRAKGPHAMMAARRLSSSHLATNWGDAMRGDDGKWYAIPLFGPSHGQRVGPHETLDESYSYLVHVALDCAGKCTD